jgi:hypothetical protein
MASLEFGLDPVEAAAIAECNALSGVMPYALDQQNAERLWEVSEKLVSQRFSLV